MVSTRLAELETLAPVITKLPKDVTVLREAEALPWKLAPFTFAEMVLVGVLLLPVELSFLQDASKNKEDTKIKAGVEIFMLCNLV